VNNPLSSETHIEPARRFDVLTMGRLTVDLYAANVGVPLSKVKQFNVYVGGCPANVVIGTRRLGLRTAMLSRIGADALSDGLIEFLRDEGVTTDYIARDPDHLSGLTFLAIQPPDTFPQRYYRTDPADMHIGMDDLARTPIEEARVLFVAGTNFAGEPSRSTTLAAMERARAAGTTVVMDIDLRATLWRDLHTFGVNIRAALPLVDILIGTEEEITAGASLESVDESVKLYHDRGIGVVAVKRGVRGADVLTRDGVVHHGTPFRVEVLNTLGAGDAWASGFIYGYLHGWDWSRCARFGNATGAIIVTRHACANDMATYDEVMAFIQSQE
jgi:5-dehydro-2-deoxygluconokinase